MENTSPLTHIIVHNAHEHNLKNLNLSLKNSLSKHYQQICQVKKLLKKC